MLVEKTAPKSPIRHAAASWVSRIIHPVIIPLFTILILLYLATQQNIAESTKWLTLAVVLTALPVAALVAVQVARGKWTDLDVSVRRQRYLLYPFGLVCLLALAVVYKLGGAPAIVVKAAIATALANLIDGVINFGYKVSAHATTAAVCATLLCVAVPLLHLAPGVAIAAVVASILVSWARVELGRHTTGQVLLGLGVGVTSVLATFAFSPAGF